MAILRQRLEDEMRIRLAGTPGRGSVDEAGMCTSDGLWAPWGLSVSRPSRVRYVTDADSVKLRCDIWTNRPSWA